MLLPINHDADEALVAEEVQSRCAGDHA